MAVTRSAEAYAARLASLMPRGPMWEPGADLTMDLLLLWIGRELARIDQRIADLLREADPRETSEMIEDWERECGLPHDLAVTIEDRRAQVVARLTARGGASRPYFIAVAEALGFPGATITEFGPLACTDPCTGAVASTLWWWTWQLNVPGVTDDPDATLESVMRRLKPAHTFVIFKYGALV
jgi:uncharacterized protein YmfQ (DUF2313 family)